jgi:glycine/D-amino acid oxidase-like deaminating enzyme
MTPHRAGHAAVLGGGMSGILAARALSDHFAEVTIIERDQLPDQPDFRKGVPQAGTCTPSGRAGCARPSSCCRASRRTCSRLALVRCGFRRTSAG